MRNGFWRPLVGRGIAGAPSLGGALILAAALLMAPLASGAAASTVSGSTYTSVTPYRITDTRPGSNLPNAGNTLGVGKTITVQVTGTGGASGVPAGATAAALNVTATNTTAASYLSVYPAGTPRPTVANLNFVAGQTVAGFMMVPLSSSGGITVFNYTGSADVVVDVDGYYGSTTTATSGPGLYNAVNPFRALGSSTQGAPFAPGAVTPVTVSGGATTIPSTASAVVVNVTAVGNAASYLTAYPAGATVPLAASLNFGPGQIISNRSVVGIGTNGQIDIYNYAGTATVDVDVDGYYSGGTTGSGSVFVPITPVRVTDTRTATNGNPIASGASESFDLATSASTIPATAMAIAANFTVVPGASAGFITVYPSSDATPPLASDVNWAAASGPVPNFTVAGTGGTGSVDVYDLPNSSPINLVIDDFGYFMATSSTSTTSSSTPSAGGGFHAIACPSTTLCVAVGQGTNGVGLVEMSTDGGTSFTDEPVPAGLPTLYGVACPDVTHCFAVGGSDFIASTDGGQSWNVEGQSGVDLYTVACESDSVCVSSGFNGSPNGSQSFFYTTDGGNTWTAGSAPSGTIGTYMTCQSSSCISVGSGLLKTVDGGATWVLEPTTGMNTTFNSAGCLPSTATCLAVGTNTGGVNTPTLPGELVISTDGGSSWTSSSALPASTATIRQVACGSATTCFVTGYPSSGSGPLVTLMTTDAGASWTSVTGPAGFAYTSSFFGALDMACTSATTCIIVGTGTSSPISFVTTNSGDTWTASTIG
jgi:hypothetical protein